MKTSKNILKYLLIVGLGVLLARFILFRDGTNTVLVRSVNTDKRVVKKTVSALGQVKATQEASISFPVGGPISSIEVSEGDELVTGAFIAALNNPETKYAVQAAKDSRDMALRDKDLFVEKYSGDKNLIGGVEQYAIQARKLDEYISQTEANYQSSLKTSYKQFLYAPFEGAVVAVYKTTGEVVSPGEPVVKIATKDKFFEVTVDQEDYGLLKVNQVVDVKLDAYAGTSFNGEVMELPQYANGTANPTFTVKISVKDTEEQILLGMTGNARITVAATSSEVNALLYDEIQFDYEENPFVWVINVNGVLEQKDVEIGLEGDLYTELKTEIKDQIVRPANSNSKLEEGFKAKFVND